MRRLGRGDKPRGKALVLPATYVHEELFVNATTPGPQQPERGICAEQVAVRSDPAQLALVDAGELTIDIAQQLPPAELSTAHDQALHGTLPGTTILTI